MISGRILPSGGIWLRHTAPGPASWGRGSLHPAKRAPPRARRPAGCQCGRQDRAASGGCRSRRRSLTEHPLQVELLPESLQGNAAASCDAEHHCNRHKDEKRLRPLTRRMIFIDLCNKYRLHRFRIGIQTTFNNLERVTNEKFLLINVFFEEFPSCRPLRQEAST